MGQTDFEFGYNDPSNRDYRTDDPPTYQQACMGMMVCPHCGKAVLCSDTANLAPIGEQQTMDLSQHKGKGGSSRLPWLDGQCIPDGKGTTLKVDAVREPRKKGTTVVFLDVTVAKDKKRYTWSIRKGFTLDALLELLGSETDDWTDKSIPVVRGGDEGQYVNVSQ